MAARSMMSAMQENYNDDDEMYASSSAGAFFGVFGGMTAFLVLGLISFVLTIVATVKASNGPKVKDQMPGAVIAMVVVSWVAWFFQVPIVNIAVPAVLIHGLRFPQGQLRGLFA